MANFGNRIFRAARLDVALYEEVEADKSALGQAMGVVILSSIAAGIGSTSAGLLRMLIGVLHKRSRKRVNVLGRNFFIHIASIALKLTKSALRFLPVQLNSVAAKRLPTLRVC